MQLTPDQLVSEFHDAVMELYFARKRIALLEAENAALTARVAAYAAERAAEPSASDAGDAGGASE
ncbi:hypothetical protein [Streptomyces yaizuensis]|uniref:Uncharacterized protein n=1 Tax=Streptomyces yaizuensis TaxID=2989713 RepID=A0ABQ5NXG4_9ACTN|nr:hypothetical protein [Streptomyces sp. YSPA8]GLF95051.1 hypothetical protein SYYSPA8_12160 [Streptomyces sp. YSPA8]